MVVCGPRGTAFLYTCMAGDSAYDQQPEEISLQEAQTNKRAGDVDYVLYDPQEDPKETQKFSLSFFCGKNVLIAVSPDLQNCSKIIKDAKIISELYMGPTDLVESEAMRVACYGTSVSAEELQQRFDQIGGIPRLLFLAKSPLPVEGYDDSVLRVISDRQNFALNDLVENPSRIDSGSVASSFKSLWALYHLVPDERFTSYKIELCCDNGRKLLRRRLLTMDVRKLWNLYYNTDQRLGALRGIRYEAYAHKKILVDGIDLMAKKLNQSAISKASEIQVLIPPGSREFALHDNNVDNLQAQRALVHQSGGGYMLPYLPSYPVIDSAFVNASNSCVMLQMKAGWSKPLSDKAASVIAALGNTFVVVTPEENIVTKQLSVAPAGMKQYVLILQETKEMLHVGTVPSCQVHVFEAHIKKGVSPSSQNTDINGCEVWRKSSDDKMPLNDLLTKGSLESIEATLQEAAERNLPMICANPDIVALGADGEPNYMPGTIAQRYEELGGKVIYFGKPHVEHFEACIRRLGVDRSRIAHVGDSLHHDVAGANSTGIDSIFITSGIHSKELECHEFGELPTTERLTRLFEKENETPTHVVPAVRL
ncbi:MAG: hypothetical protein SGARI_000862 [Bacillariaceae sp.]